MPSLLKYKANHLNFVQVYAHQLTELAKIVRWEYIVNMKEFPIFKNYKQIDLFQLDEPFRVSLANKLRELKRQDKEVWILFFKNGEDKPSAAKLKLVSSIDDFVAELWGSINIEKIQFGAGVLVPRVMIYMKNEK